QRLRTPAQVGPAREDAEAGARRVDERAVEPVLVELADVGIHHAYVRRHLLGEAPGPSGVDLDRGHVTVQEQRLAARRSARVEDALALLRADDERGKLRGAAHRTHPSR